MAITMSCWDSVLCINCHQKTSVGVGKWKLMFWTCKIKRKVFPGGAVEVHFQPCIRISNLLVCERKWLKNVLAWGIPFFTICRLIKCIIKSPGNVSKIVFENWSQDPWCDVIWQLDRVFHIKIYRYAAERMTQIRNRELERVPEWEGSVIRELHKQKRKQKMTKLRSQRHVPPPEKCKLVLGYRWFPGSGSLVPITHTHPRSLTKETILSLFAQQHLLLWAKDYMFSGDKQDRRNSAMRPCMNGLPFNTHIYTAESSDSKSRRKHYWFPRW